MLILLIANRTPKDHFYFKKIKFNRYNFYCNDELLGTYMPKKEVKLAKQIIESTRF